MNISAIGRIYWQKVKNKERTFPSVPLSKQDEVKFLADYELSSEEITLEFYNEILELQQ